MSKKIKLKVSDYHRIRDRALMEYKDLPKGSRDTAESYTAKVWTKAVIDNLNSLGLIDFVLDLEEIEYTSIDE